MAETDNSHNLRNRLLGRIHENDIYELCHVIQCCEDHSLHSNSFTLCSSTARKELLIMQPGCSLISMQSIKAGYTLNATN